MGGWIIYFIDPRLLTTRFATTPNYVRPTRLQLRLDRMDRVHFPAVCWFGGDVHTALLSQRFRCRQPRSESRKLAPENIPQIHTSTLLPPGFTVLTPARSIANDLAGKGAGDDARRTPRKEPDRPARDFA